MGEQVRVPAGRARAFGVPAGERFAVVAVDGAQVGDLVAFNAGDLTEWLSTAHTRRALNRVRVREGDVLVSTLRRPMLALVEDRVGAHDILSPPCDARRYLLDYGVAGHANCLDNLVEALAEALAPDRLEAWRIPNPVNLFQNTRIEPDGRLTQHESPARPGDRVVFEARLDLLVALSACPQDQNPVNGFRVKDLVIDRGLAIERTRP
jgi:uncharacterized protein YcgI (DUF1989 family)